MVLSHQTLRIGIIIPNIQTYGWRKNTNHILYDSVHISPPEINSCNGKSIIVADHVPMESSISSVEFPALFDDTFSGSKIARNFAAHTSTSLPSGCSHEILRVRCCTLFSPGWELGSIVTRLPTTMSSNMAGKSLNEICIKVFNFPLSDDTGEYSWSWLDISRKAGMLCYQGVIFPIETDPKLGLIDVESPPYSGLYIHILEIGTHISVSLKIRCQKCDR